MNVLVKGGMQWEMTALYKRTMIFNYFDLLTLVEVGQKHRYDPQPHYDCDYFMRVHLKGT